MFRTILSYSILVLIPLISLVIAIGPYWRLKRKISISSDIVHSGKDTVIRWSQLWLAFLIGLAGNVVWSAIVINRPERVSAYIFQTDYSGMLFAWFFYGLFIVITPSIFYTLKYKHLQLRHIIYIALITAGILLLEIGLVVYLFFLGLARLFYAFN